MVDQVAATDAPILITGESGTGKEIIARELHLRSQRRPAPFVPVNCGALTETLVESELFGHLPGAFTGAVVRKRGKFEAAEGGTLFLDEIGETSPAFQVKLLRTLQSGEYSPVGMAETRSCNVRVIAATNRDLPASMEEGSFRRDLYYRLSVIRLEIPPLRERPGDIPLLVRHFAASFAASYCKPELHLEPDFEELLARHHWPGNVRELENVVHRAVILCRGRSLSSHLLPPELRAGAWRPAAGPGAAPSNFHEAKQVAIEQFERDYLVAVLRDCGGIVSRAAGRSGLSERNFHEKLNRYGIDGQSFRGPGRA
ncbi:MAG: two-component system, NtrC family, response regulator HydG [Acidobacteriota bacterium]|jgi:transcriptional regulator with GAF, ATPase, and Fis domain|nr:two-component system, NtrC family, response regulator HydG [Acidobacteriota bacterium]